MEQQVFKLSFIIEGIAENISQWNCAFLAFSFVMECASKKMLQFLMPLEPIYNANFCFDEQKCLL